MKLPYEPLFDEGEGEIIVLLQNLYGPLDDLKNLILQLTDTHRVLVPRLPFYSYPATSERCEDLIQYLDQFLSVHTADKVVLIGNGIGGYLSLLYAWHYPLKVKRLILTAVPRLTETSFIEPIQIPENEFLFEEMDTQIPGFQETYCIDENSEMLHTFSVSRKNSCGVVPSLTQIIAPVLLICGLYGSPTPPEEAFEFHNLLPFSKIIFLDNHHNTTSSVHFVNHVRDFLK